MLKEQCMTLERFAKTLNYKSCRDPEFSTILRALIKRGWAEIQQGGYKGHSKHHPRLIAIREPLEIDHFKKTLEKLQVNYAVGDFTIHQTMKTRKCDRCKTQILKGERYGARPLVGRYGGVRQLTVLCFPCLINDYEEFYDVK